MHTNTRYQIQYHTGRYSTVAVPGAEMLWRDLARPSTSYYVWGPPPLDQVIKYDIFSKPCVKGLFQRDLPPFLAFSRSFIITTR